MWGERGDTLKKEKAEKQHRNLEEKQIGEIANFQYLIIHQIFFIKKITAYI